MKKVSKLLMVLFLMLTMALSLCACGEDSGSKSSRSSKKQTQKDDDEDEDKEEDDEDEDDEEDDDEDDEDSGKKKKKKKTADEDNKGEEDPQDIDQADTDETDASKGEDAAENDEKTAKTQAPESLDVCIDMKDDMFWRDETRDLLIDFRYEQVGLSRETQEKYPELYKSLIGINDVIATEEANFVMTDLKNLQNKTDQEIRRAIDDEELPYRDKWEIQIKRADAELLSFIVCATSYRGEYINTRYTTYNIVPETGKLLTMEDVIADKDAVYERLADRLLYVFTDFLSGAEGDTANAKKQVVDNLREDYAQGFNVGWVLGTEGVTFTINPMVFAPIDTMIPVAFTDDPDGKLFRDEWRYPAGADWAAQLRLYDTFTFDADDDGQTDSLILQESYSTYENGTPGSDDYVTYEYLSGLDVYFDSNDAMTLELGEELTIDDVYLVHRGGRSFLMISYSEYDWNDVVVFSLQKGKLENTDAVFGWFDWPDYYDDPPEEHEFYPRAMVTDPSEIKIRVLSELLSMVYLDMPYTLTPEGKFRAKKSILPIDEEQQYKLTAKQAVKGLPVVDEKRMRETQETVDIAKGDTLTLAYTDLNTFVDCRLEDGSLVRVYVYTSDPDDEEAEFWHYIISGGKKLNPYEIFDGMFFAG